MGDGVEHEHRADPPDGPPAGAPAGAPDRSGFLAETRPVAVGTGVWALLFAIGLVIRDDLAGSGREWWVWTAGAGVALGFVGYAYLHRRHARMLSRRTPGRP